MVINIAKTKYHQNNGIYLRRRPEKGEYHNLTSLIDEEIRRTILSNLTPRIVGNICYKLASTSVGKILGVKIKTAANRVDGSARVNQRNAPLPTPSVRSGALSFLKIIHRMFFLMSILGGSQSIFLAALYTGQNYFVLYK